MGILGKEGFWARAYLSGLRVNQELHSQKRTERLDQRWRDRLGDSTPTTNMNGFPLSGELTGQMSYEFPIRARRPSR
jgi:hypothetical protein